LPCKEAFAEAADAGYKGYHLVLSPEKMATVETELADAKRASEEIGLGISSVEWRRQTESSTGLHEELEAAIEAAAALGAPRLVIGASSRPVNPSEMAMSIQKEADIFSEVLDSDKAQNIEVCIRMKPHTLAHDH
jgi:sugar phosphate isomerase/epimerase